MAEKVFVAMSGGVDSSVAAYLLIERGYDVSGVTMLIGENDAAVADDAASVSKSLKIDHYVFDFSSDFKKLVMEPFVSEYLNGRTPNPCVLCNYEIKWGKLLEKALDMGADFVATGHYANIVNIGKRFSLKSSGVKDQTYSLYKLTQNQLKRTMFPLGDFTKPEVRSIAEAAGLAVFDKPDSQDICFIKDGDYAAFIQKYTGREEQQGNFVLADGTVLGIHKGISNYTVGQRKGLGISFSEPLFVQRINILENSVVLGSDVELFSKEFSVKGVNYMGVSEIEGEMSCVAKVRYAHKGSECIIRPGEAGSDKLSCRFTEPQRAITPGQSAVFYFEDVVIAGGIIDGSGYY